jgi:hypothetical protein
MCVSVSTLQYAHITIYLTPAQITRLLERYKPSSPRSDGQKTPLDHIKFRSYEAGLCNILPYAPARADEFWTLVRATPPCPQTRDLPLLLPQNVGIYEYS